MPHTSDTYKERHISRSATGSRTSRTFSSGAYLERLMAELDRAAICARIAQARTEAGLTQPELGEAMAPPVHWRTVQTWESVKEPRVPWARLNEIASLTGKSKEWLLHGEEATAEHATRDAVMQFLTALDRRLDTEVLPRLEAIELEIRRLAAATTTAR